MYELNNVWVRNLVIFFATFIGEDFFHWGDVAIPFVLIAILSREMENSLLTQLLRHFFRSNMSLVGRGVSKKLQKEFDSSSFPKLTVSVFFFFLVHLFSVEAESIHVIHNNVVLGRM